MNRAVLFIKTFQEVCQRCRLQDKIKSVHSFILESSFVLNKVMNTHMNTHFETTDIPELGSQILDASQTQLNSQKTEKAVYSTAAICPALYSEGLRRGSERKPL